MKLEQELLDELSRAYVALENFNDWRSYLESRDLFIGLCGRIVREDDFIFRGYINYAIKHRADQDGLLALRVYVHQNFLS
jgi:hypothetical protein